MVNRLVKSIEKWRCDRPDSKFLKELLSVRDLKIVPSHTDTAANNSLQEDKIVGFYQVLHITITLICLVNFDIKTLE